LWRCRLRRVKAFHGSIPVSECNTVTKTLLLDLDGTLVHSVPDLAAALNRLMRARGLAGFTEAETARMVGDGVVKLVERAFAARERATD
jgi:phosphoglycolate phosphatase